MQAMRAIRAEAGPDADLIDGVSVMEKWSDYDLDAGLGRTTVVKDGYRVVDADAHVIEPDDLWARYFDAVAARPRARDTSTARSRSRSTACRSTRPADWETDTSAEQTARRDERISATFAELFPAAYARGFDAVAQLADMDIEGVDLAFLYPSYGLFATASNELDPVIAAATSRAYNNWLADFCGGDRDRLHGVGMIALQDPDAAAAEVLRVHDDLGFRAVFARPNPIAGRNLDDPAYEPVWKALSERQMTIGLHEGGMPPLPQAGSDRLTNAEQKHICSHPMEQMVAAVSLIYGGVLERFPGLQVAFLEAGCGWVPFWLERMDDHYEKGLARDFGAANDLTMRAERVLRAPVLRVGRRRRGDARAGHRAARRRAHRVLDRLPTSRFEVPSRRRELPGLARRERRQQTAHPLGQRAGAVRDRPTRRGVVMTAALGDHPGGGVAPPRRAYAGGPLRRRVGEQSPGSVRIAGLS